MGIRKRVCSFSLGYREPNNTMGNLSLSESLKLSRCIALAHTSSAQNTVKRTMLLVLLSGLCLLQCKAQVTSEVLWQRCIGGSDWDHGFRAIETGDGGIVSVGYGFSTDGDLAATHGSHDVVVLVCHSRHHSVLDITPHEKLSQGRRASSTLERPRRKVYNFSCENVLQTSINVYAKIGRHTP